MLHRTRHTLLILIYLVSLSVCQNRRPSLRYCTITENEWRKCNDWALQVSLNPLFEFTLQCVRTGDKDQCMRLIEDEKVDMVLLDPGEVYIAGRYHSLVPIVYEKYGSVNQTDYLSVAVVKKSSVSYIQSLKDLRDKKACFSGVGQLSGWVLPLTRLLEQDLIDITDCNNIIHNTAKFFGPSCAPGALIDKYNPIGTNPQSVCSLCASGRCSGNDLYAGSEGALLCLLNGGDVAFVRHPTIDQLTRTSPFRKQEFELLCPNGQRRTVDEYHSCHWGEAPSYAVVISSVVMPQMREKIQNFLLQSSSYFSGPGVAGLPGTISTSRNLPSTFSTSKGPFHLFESAKYGSLNLIFNDDTVSLAPVEFGRQTFRGYFSYFKSNLDMANLYKNLRKCYVPTAKLCVISSHELDKCNHMKSAFRTNNLKPELSCVKGETTIDCMRKVHNGEADLTVLDAGDLYVAGQRYGLEPIVAEQNYLNDSYYVVAIAKKADQLTDLLYLKGKQSCHAGYKTAAGWVIPMAFLLSNSRMRSYGCNSIRAASEFFSKSCVPGALTDDFNRGNPVWAFDNLCGLCHGDSYRYCRRDASEPYFGDTGAMKCLVEGGGDIAFAKHTTIFENTNGINPNHWARNKILDDFELLCRDGTRSEVKDFVKCNLGQVASNAIVTNRYKTYNQKEAYIALFLYAQRFYGSKYSEEFTFKMFVSNSNHKDLIFQDSTVKLKPVGNEKRDYRRYLGHEFLRAMELVDCTAGAHQPFLFATFLLTTSLCLLFHYIL